MIGRPPRAPAVSRWSSTTSSMIQAMITPDLDQLHASMESAKAAEAQFWTRTAELGIPDGLAWDALRVVLEEIQSGTDHTDPWAIAADLLAAGARATPE